MCARYKSSKKTLFKNYAQFYKYLSYFPRKYDVICIKILGPKQIS